MVGAAAGLANKEIAYNLKTTEQTVKNHMSKIIRQLGVHSRIGAMHALGWVAVPEMSVLLAQHIRIRRAAEIRAILSEIQSLRDELQQIEQAE